MGTTVMGYILAGRSGDCIVVTGLALRLRLGGWEPYLRQRGVALEGILDLSSDLARIRF